MDRENPARPHTPADIDGDGRPSAQARWLVSGAIVTAVIAVAFVAGASGSAGRSSQSGAAVTQTATETVRVLESTGVRGAVALIVTEDLGYTPVPVPSPPELLDWPVERVDLRERYLEGADRDSWAWVLAKTGIARRIDYLLPTSAFERRVTEGRAAGLPGIAADGRSVLANDEGYMRYIAPEARPLDGPLVLIVDASYFRSGVAAELATRLQQLDTVPTAVVLYRAIEDTSVPEAARTALDGALPGLGQVQP